MKLATRRAVPVGALVVVAATLFAVGFVTPAAGDEPCANPPSALWEALLRLRHTGSALHVTAHPDDEDATVLTWLGRVRGARAALLTLTRGESGARLLGPSEESSLAVLRTEELLAADRHYHVEQIFGGLPDFGYSKRSAEALERWGHERALKQVVRVMRAYRPDVVIARYQGNDSDGHGHHQASGILAREAFVAAGDPTRFAELEAEGLKPWSPSKFYYGANPKEPYTFHVPVTAYDAIVGKTVQAMARAGYNQHRSQGAAHIPFFGKPGEAFLTRVDAAKKRSDGQLVAHERDVFDGVPVTLFEAASRAHAAKTTMNAVRAAEVAARDATSSYDSRAPDRCTGPLVRGLRAIRAARSGLSAGREQTGAQEHLGFLLRRKELEFERALTLSLGFRLVATVDGSPTHAQPLIPGETRNVVVRVSQHGQAKVELRDVQLRTPRGWSTTPVKRPPPHVANSGVATATFQVNVASLHSFVDDADRLYTVAESGSLVRTLPVEMKPFPEAALVATARLTIDGVDVRVEAPVRVRWVDAIHGEQHQLASVLPQVSLRVEPATSVMVTSQKSVRLRVHLLNSGMNAVDGIARLRVPSGLRVEPSSAPFHLHHASSEHTVDFDLVPDRIVRGQTYSVQAFADAGGKAYDEGYTTIAYPGLETRYRFEKAASSLRAVDVRLPSPLRIGYVMGVEDHVAGLLAQAGAKVDLLTRQDLAFGSLNRFDTIVVGVRALAIRPDLIAHYSRLLRFVEMGGNLVVQYQTSELDAGPYAPYPYRLGQDPEEVSEESAAVTFIDPSHPALLWPNTLTKSDFDGWVEQRGSKFMTDWDARYVPLLECHDRGQSPQKGGLLVTSYGRGTFVYAAYAFHRQLPAGVEGAFRLLANLVSLPKNRAYLRSLRRPVRKTIEAFHEAI